MFQQLSFQRHFFPFLLVSVLYQLGCLLCLPIFFYSFVWYCIHHSILVDPNHFFYPQHFIHCVFFPIVIILPIFFSPELHCLKLCLLIHLIQVLMVSFSISFVNSESTVSESDRNTKKKRPLRQNLSIKASVQACKINHLFYLNLFLLTGLLWNGLQNIPERQHLLHPQLCTLCPQLTSVFLSLLYATWTY